MRKKLGKLIDDLGYINAFLYVCANMLRSLFGRELLFKYYLVVQPIRPLKLLSERRAKNYTVREILAGDPLLDEFPRDRKVLDARFDGRTSCFAVFHNDVLEGFMWVGRKFYDEDEVKCRFRLHPEKEMVWDYDVYIFPKNRLSFAFPKLWQDVNQHLVDEGYKWTASRISAFNQESIRAHARLGGQIVGSVLFFVVGNFQIMLSSIPPRLHVGISKNKVPVLNIHAPEQSC